MTVLKRAGTAVVIALAAWSTLAAQETVADYQGPKPEEYLAKAKIKAIRDLGQGVTLPKKVTLERDGVEHFAVFKSIDETKAGVTRMGDGSMEVDFQDSWQRAELTAVKRAWLLQERMGKTPIHSADQPGFVVNRYFVPWLNEAVRLLEDGVADVPTVEAACKRAFGVDMGPFELMNVTGIPIALHAATTLGEAFGPFYAPSPRLRAQVATGSSWPLEGEPDASLFDEVADRMWAVVFMVASALVDQEVGSVEDVDIGARVGLRWPRGPFESMNRLGVDKAAREVFDERDDD